MNKDYLFLNSLRLNNFATFNDETITFKDGLNIIIGETGSGKSLIFDALQIVLGQRADKRFVRSNTELATIEAFFDTDSPQVFNYLDKIGYPSTQNDIVLKRILYASGKTKSFINYQQCNLQDLQKFSKKYIDLVGQFENQKLLTQSYQLKLVDQHANNQKCLSDYRTIFDEYGKLTEQKKILTEKKEIRDQQLDFLNFQIDEIEAVSPESDEETVLIDKKNYFLSKKDNVQFYQNLNFLLFESENSVQTTLSHIKKTISNNSQFLNKEQHESFNNITNLFEEFSFQMAQPNDEIDDQELESIIDRLDKIQKLKRKFGPDVESILSKLEEFKDEKKLLDGLNERIEELKTKITEIYQQLDEQSKLLSARREASAQSISKKLSHELQLLNMKEAKVKISIDPIENFDKNGKDRINFLVETNPGEGFHPIQKVASGGELSRILLSIRKILVSDSISIFLFDEVDTGMGGETALLIGKSLKNVAERSQVIAISHLPQIAINADTIVKVEKIVKSISGEKRTLSNAHIISSSDNIMKETQRMVPLS